MNSDLQPLVDEYKTLAASNSSINWEQIEAKLIDHHAWSETHALTVVNLVREYGGFVLRNAAALAIAFEYEDGDSNV